MLIQNQGNNITAQARKKNIHCKEFLIFSYISGNGNPEKIPYISGNRNPTKLLIFQEMELLSPSSKNKKKTSEKSSYSFLFFRKWNIPGLILRNFLHSLKRKLFLYFGKRKPRKNSLCLRKRNFFYISWTNFPRSKKEKTPWKNFLLYLRKWNFQAPSLKIVLYFRRELAKPQAKKGYYF